jgi:hypothetical protein
VHLTGFQHLQLTLKRRPHLNPIFDQIRGRGHRALLRALPAKHIREVRATRGRAALDAAAGCEFTKRRSAKREVAEGNKQMSTKRSVDAHARIEWHAEVARAVLGAIEPLSQKAPPGESIEVAVQVTTYDSEVRILYFLDGKGVKTKSWLD